ncbi:MAG TPA: sigma 54-interacting transcriptional regulator [Polyangia bacterium]
MSLSEKTQTAVQSPLSAAELPDTAVLLMLGAADHPGLPTARRFALVHDGLEIGRRPSDEAESQGAALTVIDSLVSSRHARITRRGGEFELTDLGSKNGTFIDNVRVEDHARLRNGSLLFFGNHIAVFRMVSTLELDAIKADLVAPLGPVATCSPTLALACDRLRRLAGADGEILLLGETGVGKEVYARAVHQLSQRRGRFMAINCGAIPRDLVESELFGYRQGAHSTAHQAKAGLIEEAEGGTLFLDEIGEMTHEAQIKLLRFLQDRELTPLGSTRPRKIDVRIIAATNRTSGTGKSPTGLRDDIIGRLGAAPLHLPPLRSRIEDLGALAAHFLRASNARAFEQPAFRALALYDWPMNIRELEKIVSTAAVLTGGTRPISLRDLPEPIAQAAAATPASARRTTAGPSPTPEQIEDLLRRYNGNVADVSRELGKHRAAVWRWMKKWGIGVEKYRKPDQP